MDTTSLVDNLIQDGQKLLERLPQEGFDVTAAFWVKEPETAEREERWRFCIVSPIAEREGLARGYGRLHALIQQMPCPFGIDGLKVKLLGPMDPMAQDVLNIHRVHPRTATCPTLWEGKTLGGVSIAGAYLYPPPALATAK